MALKNKQLIRITDLDLWRGDNRAEPLGFPNFELDATAPVINRSLLLDLGDWVPYQKGTPVKINVMDRDGRGVKMLVIHRDGKVVEEIPLPGPGQQERRFEVCGNYTAHVIHADDTASQACEFTVSDLDLHLPGDRLTFGKDWSIAFNSENITVIAVYVFNSNDSYGRHRLFLTPEQRSAGVLTIPGELVKNPGKLQVWLIGEHPLGRLKLRKDITLVK